MLPSLAHLFEHLLRFLWPPPGRHRYGAAPPITLIAQDLHVMQVTA